MQLKKYNKERMLNVFLLIAWMITIFIFSNQNGTESTEKSKLVIDIFNYMGLNLNSILGDMANFIVRKGAHMTEYFILCMLFNRVISHKYALKKSLLMSIMCSFLYACSDEYHQTFIPGRAGLFRDVLIDTSGASIYVMICFLLHINKNWLKAKQ